jgi:uncharacterized protein (DUF427 family)
MGLSWQQGPLSPGAIGRFLVPEPLPKRLLYIEPLRRRMRVRFGGSWIADSENVVLLFEPGHYPMAYFPEADVFPKALQNTEHTSHHPDLGLTSWYTVQAGRQSAPRGAWQHTNFLSFEPDIVSVQLDGKQLHLEPGQTVIPHGPERELTVAATQVGMSGYAVNFFDE